MTITIGERNANATSSNFGAIRSKNGLCDVIGICDVWWILISGQTVLGIFEEYQEWLKNHLS